MRGRFISQHQVEGMLGARDNRLVNQSETEMFVHLYVFPVLSFDIAGCVVQVEPF